MTIDPVSLAINAALIAASAAVTASQEFEGPRLDELSVTTADYGAPLNYAYGTRRFDGVSCIWAEPLTEVKRRRKTKGGKFNEYSYFGTWAVAVCDHEIDAFTRLWFDRNLIYDATGGGPLTPFPELGDITQYIRFYRGTADQDIDPRMSATVDAEFGAGSTPAYRGVAYIVFEDVPLEKLGNRLPQVSVEVICNGAESFPYDERASEHGFATSGRAALSPDGTRLFFGTGEDYEIWDVAARALMVSGQLDETTGALHSTGLVGMDDAGRIYAAGGSNLYRYPPDGIGTQEVAATGCNDARSVFVLKDGAGIERAYITREAQANNGYLYNIASDVLTFIDLAVETGVTWDMKWACKDTHGDIWVFGGEDSIISFGPLATNELAIWRAVNVSGRVGPDFARVIMPVSQGPIVDVAAYHYADADVDHFVVRWAGANLYTIDTTTFAITNSRTSLSFDPDNMNYPFASVQPSAASIWLGEHEVSSVDLSDVRVVDVDDWTVGASSSLLIYDRINHALITSFVGGVIVSIPFGWLYLDRVAGDGVTLQSIVEDVSTRCGLDVANDIDASDLTQTVYGYSWVQGQGKAILEPALEAYDSDSRPHDFKVEFLRRGDAALGTIDVSDMGAVAGDARATRGATRYSIETTLDTDLPLKVSMTFADLDKDQQPNTALGQRSSFATDSRRELSLDATTLALDADEARQKADGYLRREWMKAQTYGLAVSRKWTKLEPADAYTLTLDDISRTAKLKDLEFGANGVLTTTWERYSPSVHVATTLPGAPADGLTPAVLPSFGYTKGIALDIPLARDADNATSPFLYLAGAPYSPDLAWPGAIFYRSDDAVTYDTEIGEVAASQVATMGYALSALPDALSTVWDEASTVSIKMFDGELTSASADDVMGGTNWAAFGAPGRWEIIGFRVASLVATDTYQISSFLRGLRGTEWATGLHENGDTFVLLGSLPKATIDASDVGDDFYVKPVTNGGAGGFPQHVDPFEGVTLKPYSPVHLSVEDVGGDLVVTWIRRTRIGGSVTTGLGPPLGETAESYNAHVLDGSGVLVRNLGPVSSPEVTYSSADQAADSNTGEIIRVWQVSSVVGNGYHSDIAV